MIVVNFIQCNEKLSASMYKGIISLLYKSGNREEIKNWRPITLLNIDYKVIAKCLAERLKKVLPSIINPDQRAYIQGRQISESIRLTLDILDQQNNNGCIIFLDQQKAFDRVEWGYLKICLESFGFGPKFITNVMMLYRYGQSCINTNGFLSKYFPISRSMRQGCPIAAYLYIVQAEPMAETIRKEKRIKGIDVPTPAPYITNHVKISSFADDTQLFLNDIESMKICFSILEIYSKASGAKININKTKGLGLGTWKENPPDFNNIEWINSIKALGIYFGHNINYNEIMQKCLDKCKKKLEKWKKRDLTLQGKRVLINSYILSDVGYIMEMYPNHVTQNFIQSLKEMCCNFLWKGKSWKISQKTMSLMRKHGGFEFPDFETLLKTKKIKWILNIISKPLNSWNSCGQHILRYFDHFFKQNYFLLECSDTRKLDLTNIPAFYTTCIESWIEMNTKQKVDTKTGVLKQNINANKYLQYKREPFSFMKWSEYGITQINHLWDIHKNCWKAQSNHIFDELKTQPEWSNQYSQS